MGPLPSAPESLDFITYAIHPPPMPKPEYPYRGSRDWAVRTVESKRETTCPLSRRWAKWFGWTSVGFPSVYPFVGQGSGLV